MLHVVGPREMTATVDGTVVMVHTTLQRILPVVAEINPPFRLYG